MRVQLKKGKQKELIYWIKEENNLTWGEFSKFLNVSKSALLEWSKEYNLLPLEVYKKLDPSKTYKKFIVELKEENWGRISGGLNSPGSLIEIKIPPKCEKLSELVGIILGDGNIFSYKKGKKIGVYSLKIAGHSEHDKEYHINYIKPLCETLFGIDAKIQTLKNKNGRFVSLFSKKVVDYFENMGLKAGNKIKNQNTIPKWIFDDKRFLRACIRGLIDTDGSIFRMSNKDPHLLRINFKNHNFKLINDARDAFIILGFHPSKIIRGNVFYLSRKEDIVRYINEIGFSNPKHINRFQKFTAL